MDGYIHPTIINYDTPFPESGYLSPKKHDEGTRGGRHDAGPPIPLPRQPRYINTDGGRREGDMKDTHREVVHKRGRVAGVEAGSGLQGIEDRGRQLGEGEKNRQDVGNTGGYLSPTLTEYNTSPSSHHLSSPIDIKPPGSKTRFDSGVGDLEMHGLSDSTSPRRSKAYEYMDNFSHYEEVPTLHRDSKPPSLPLREDMGQSSPPIGGMRSVKGNLRSPDSQTTQLSGATEPASDTDDGCAVTFRTGSKRRKITNPLYSRLMSVASSIFSDGHSTKKVDILERQIQCQCAVILILFIVTLGSSALSIYLMIGQSKDFVNNNELLMRVKKLEEENKKFFQSSTVETNKTVYNFNEIYVIEKQMELKYENLSSQLSSFTDSVQEQLSNISKMPGPPGVGNLSACFYKNHTTLSQGSDQTTSSTRWLPDLADLSEYVVMSAMCSVSGGTRKNIKTKVHTEQWVQYQCECTGAIPGEALRQCLIHLVLCPRFS